MIWFQIKSIWWRAETGGTELQAHGLGTAATENSEAIQVLRVTVETGLAQGFVQPFL